MGSLQYLLEKGKTSKSTPSINEFVDQLMTSRGSIEALVSMISDSTAQSAAMGKRIDQLEVVSGEWVAALGKLQSEVEGMRRALSSEVSKVSEAATKMDKGQILSAVDALKTAIYGIRMPEIPQAKEVSLDGLERAISRKIDTQLELLKNVIATQEVIEPPKKSWTFLVDRDSQGYIKQIRAV